MYYLTNTAQGTTMEARETVPGVSQDVPPELVPHVFAMLSINRSCRMVDGIVETSPESCPCDGARFDWDIGQWVGP